jgi:hypothetical protein
MGRAVTGRRTVVWAEARGEAGSDELTEEDDRPDMANAGGCTQKSAVMCVLEDVVAIYTALPVRHESAKGRAYVLDTSSTPVSVSL